LHFSKSRNLIGRLDKEIPLRLGIQIVDSKLKVIGTVQDLFGPVNAPYISIRPTVAEPEKYAGRIAYSVH
jgi:rRNA processing protein Gar1